MLNDNTHRVAAASTKLARCFIRLCNTFPEEVDHPADIEVHRVVVHIPDSAVACRKPLPGEVRRRAAST